MNTLFLIAYVLFGAGLAIVVGNHSEDRGDGWPTFTAACLLSFVLWPLVAGMYLGYAMIELLAMDRSRKRQDEADKISEQRRGNATVTIPKGG